MNQPSPETVKLLLQLIRKTSLPILLAERKKMQEQEQKKA